MRTHARDMNTSVYAVKLVYTRVKHDCIYAERSLNSRAGGMKYVMYILTCCWQLITRRGARGRDRERIDDDRGESWLSGLRLRDLRQRSRQHPRA
jgi:hypothetical protein